MFETLYGGVHWLIRVCQVAWRFWKGTKKLANWGDYPHTQEDRKVCANHPGISPFTPWKNVCQVP